jgi:hypothetical protein
MRRYTPFVNVFAILNPLSSSLACDALIDDHIASPITLFVNGSHVGTFSTEGERPVSLPISNCHGVVTFVVVINGTGMRFNLTRGPDMDGVFHISD